MDNSKLDQLSLFPLAVMEQANLMTNSVQTLLAISHSLEDILVQQRLRTTYYAGFQKFSAFLPQQQRFRRLAQVCERIVVFGQADAPVPNIPQIQFVALASNAPLVQEWFILVDDPTFCAALLTRQIGGHSTGPISARGFDPLRMYEGVLTFQTQVVEAARVALANALGELHARELERTPDSSPAYTRFGSALARNLEKQNRELVALYRELGQQNQEMERLQNVVRTYVSKTAWAAAETRAQTESNAPNMSETDARQETLTVLVTDIADFTKLTETALPSELFDALNRYFDALATVVYQHNGDVDKFLGDGMLAFFHAPHDALQTALAILRRVEAFNAQQIASRSLVLPTRVALATGSGIIGHVGSRTRQEVTVLGDVVNLASRLQALAAPGGLVMDRATFEQVGAMPDVERVQTRVRGKSDLQTVYRVSPEQIETFPRAPLAS